MHGAEALVELRGVSKSFLEGGREHVVLRGADMVVEPASFAVLLGRSGTGKSTVLNLISGIDLPSDGEVRVAGTSLGQLDETRRTLFRRRHMGFVFQFFNLVPTLSVVENVMLPLELLRGHSRGHRRAAEAWLEQVGLEGRAGSYPDRLSGGEQQRVAIVRALIHGPDLVLADEPTGNLDPEIGGDVLVLLERLVRDNRTTLLVATHSREVARRADRVLRIQDHRLLPVAPDPP